MKYGPVQTPKIYYTIGEVSAQLGIAEHQLRYWETRFPMLRPRKTRSGIRHYRARDMELLARIREMLGSLGLSYAEALQRLQVKREPVPALPKKHPNLKTLLDLRREVQLTLAMLREKKPDRS